MNRLNQLKMAKLWPFPMSLLLSFVQGD